MNLKKTVNRVADSKVNKVFDSIDSLVRVKIVDSEYQLPGAVEAEIKENQELIDSYCDNLVSLTDLGIRAADIVLAVNSSLSDPNRNKLLEALNNNYGNTYSSVSQVALDYGYGPVLKFINSFDLPHKELQMAVVSLLIDYGKLNDAETSLTSLVDSGKATIEDILAKIDEVFPEKIDDLSYELSEEFDEVESLDDTLLAYYNHSDFEPTRTLEVISASLSDSDRAKLISNLI